MSRPGARYVSTSSPPSDCLFSISFSSFYVSLFPLRFLGALPSSPAGGSTCRASSVTSPSPPYLISLILSPSGVWPPLAVLWSLPLRGLALPPPPRPGVYLVSLLQSSLPGFTLVLLVLALAPSTTQISTPCALYSALLCDPVSPPPSAVSGLTVLYQTRLSPDALLFQIPGSTCGFPC